MHLKHLNLTVTDVHASRAFLETYFGMSCIGSRGSGFAALTDGTGFILSLMKAKSAQYPETFHIGFPMPDEAAVDRMNERLRADGYAVDAPVHAHGYTFYVKAPGGFTVEVLC